MSHSTSTTPPSASEYPVDADSGGVLIPLGGKKHPGLFAIVDAVDAPKVLEHGWSAFRPSPRGDRVLLYVKCTSNNKSVYLHRFILGVTDPKVKIDHENHNGLDCRQSNLRIVTHQQNTFNRRPNLNARSRYKGVWWHYAVDKWCAGITMNGKRKHLGVYDNEIDAAISYDVAAHELFGEHAYLNFPNEASL